MYVNSLLIRLLPCGNLETKRSRRRRRRRWWWWWWWWWRRRRKGVGFRVQGLIENKL
jgi:hypothetical protein